MILRQEPVFVQQQIMKVQEEMDERREAVEAMTFTASAGGGVVTASVNGKKEVTALAIKPEAVDPEEVEMLQDMIISAVNEAIRQWRQSKK